MRKRTIEVYSDVTRRVILRQPDRRFPGMLIQGGTLFAMRQSVARTIQETTYRGEGYDIPQGLLEDLSNRVAFYKRVLQDHEIGLPFYES